MIEKLAIKGWFTRQEAAARLGIAVHTLDWQRARGQHRSMTSNRIRVGGRRRLLYNERELIRYAGRAAKRDAEARRKLVTAIRFHTHKRLLIQEVAILRRIRRQVAA